MAAVGQDFAGMQQANVTFLAMEVLGAATVPDDLLEMRAMLATHGESSADTPEPHRTVKVPAAACPRRRPGEVSF
jgi:hypothetical protein